MQELVTTWSLELTQPPTGVSPSPTLGAASRSYDLRRAESVCPQLNRFLYASVGADWTWYMRLRWTYAEWMTFLDRAEVTTWVAYVGGNPAGYFELERQPGDSVEIVYFGLLPQYIGKGIGSALLEDAIAVARASGGRRIWLHTCSLDHPAALANYQARGFTIFDTTMKYEELPDEPLQPWPGAFPAA